jgi:hypothetical protein
MTTNAVGRRHLVLAKESFHRGCSDLHSSGPLSVGFAVSAFQDAVEFALVGVAHHVSASLEQGFESLWRSIDQKCPTSLLPRKPSMQALNKARVLFKHYGTCPDLHDAAELRADCHLFLREVTELHFQTSFDSISGIELLEESDLKACLAKCSRLLDRGEIKSALEGCADARALIRASEEPLYQTALLVQFNNVPADIKREIMLQATNLREQVWRLRELVLANHFGINFVELGLLRSLVPQRVGATYEWPAGSLENAKAANVDRAITLLTRYAINVARAWSVTAAPAWN